jgi:hypothetical protein
MHGVFFGAFASKRETEDLSISRFGFCRALMRQSRNQVIRMPVKGMSNGKSWAGVIYPTGSYLSASHPGQHQ